MVAQLSLDHILTAQAATAHHVASCALSQDETMELGSTLSALLYFCMAAGAEL